MKKFKIKSLTMRIWITFVIFVVVIITAISLIYLTFVKRMDETNQKVNLQIAHETLLEVMSQNSGFSPAAPPRIDFNKQRNFKHLIIRILSESQIDIQPFDIHFEGNPAQLYPLANWFKSYINDHTLQKQSYKGVYLNKEYLFNISYITTKGGVNSYLVSYVYYVEKNDIIYFASLIGLIFIIIALIVSKIISHYISRPLKQLELQAIKIAHKEWVEPLTPSSEDEIGSLIQSINYMQASLQQADAEERKFLQSISHDLKTPIMVIMSHAEAIKDGIYIDSLENTADIIKTEAQHLEKKVKQILYYNTLDYALDNEQDTLDIDLKKLIDYMTRRLEPLRPELEWKLSLRSVMIHGNSERLQVALENILENQIRYATSFIKIVLRQDGNHAIIHISNDGPFISQELLPHIFKKLYRGNKGNFGLGLAITAKIISFYKGNVSAENISKGVLFKIKLPLAKELSNQ